MEIVKILMVSRYAGTAVSRVSKKSRFWGKSLPLANILTTHHRKMNFFLISLLENLELSEKVPIFASRKEPI